MSDLKFNVIIPTRERADTLFHCLKTVVSQNYDNLNIIVSDNFSQDNTKEVIHSFSDARIRYINPGKRVSMSDNWEFALTHVESGWVTFIGDDDGLLPDALKKVAEIALSTKLQAITSNYCRYAWPVPSFPYPSHLILPLSQGFELRNTKEWLNKIMNGQGTYLDLPHLYTNGFVDYNVIRQAYAKKNRFFNSFNPDVYSAVAFSSLLSEYVFLKEPVALTGTSKNSNGASATNISGTDEPKLKFISENTIPWPEKLGGTNTLVPSLSLYVYECFLQTQHFRTEEEPVDMLNNQLLVAISLAKKRYKAEVKNFCVTVAKLNNIDFETIKKKRLQQYWIKYKYLFFEAKRLFSCMRINTAGMGVKDVYDATIAAKSIYIVMVNYKHWRLKTIFSSIKDYLRAF